MSRNGSSIAGVGCAIQLGVFAVIVIGGLLLLQTAAGLPISLFSGLNPQPTPTVVVLPPVLKVIQEKPKLETTSYFLTTVADVKKTVGLLKQEQRVILVACGTVTAGIDLSKITAANISVRGETVVIQLPEAELFRTALVENRDSTCTYVAYLSYGFLLESDPKMESEARQQAMASMQATALDNGILDTAQKNAETEVRRLLFLVGYKSVEFAP
jgi:hypothetical protein